MSSKIPEESKLGHGNQRPKIKLAQALIPDLIASNFDDDLIKDETASLKTPFPIKI